MANPARRGAEALASTPNMEVADLAGAPEKAAIRNDFDKRDKTESVFRAILTRAGSALVLSIILPFVLSWKFCWRIRKTA